MFDNNTNSKESLDSGSAVNYTINQYKYFNSVFRHRGKRLQSKRHYSVFDDNKVLQKYFHDVGHENTFDTRQEIEYSIKIKQLESRKKIINSTLRETIRSYNHIYNLERDYKDRAGLQFLKKRKRVKKNIFILQTLYRVVSLKIDEYKSRFASANLKLVISLSKNFINRGLPYSDLIQEGNIGLLKAISKFDHTRGYKFSTYASWWIIQSINRSILEQTRLIRVPIRVQEQYTKLNKQKYNLIRTEGSTPTNEQISRVSGINPKKIKKIFKALSVSVISMDTPVYNDNNSNTYVKDSIKDPDSGVDVTISRIEMNHKITEALSQLNEREQTILNMRFGIGYNHNYTLDEIGNYYGLTRERIRQIVRRALKKIRTNSYGSILREFVE